MSHAHKDLCPEISTNIEKKLVFIHRTLSSNLLHRIFCSDITALILRKINISELSLDTKLSVILFVINSFIFPLTE